MEARDLLQRWDTKLLFLAVLLLTGRYGVGGQFMEDSYMDSATDMVMSLQPTYCPPEYLYCLEHEVCIHKEDGSCLPECDTWHDEYLLETGDGHYTCESYSDTNDVSGDHYSCYNDDQCTQCRSDEVFCMESGTCVMPDGSCITHDDNDKECGDGYVFCMESGTCVMPDGSCSTHDDDDGEGECGDGYELCYEWSESHDMWSTFCAEAGTNCGRYQEECSDGTCTSCPQGQVFCFASGKCCNPDGSCPCTDMEEECWSTGSKVCVASGKCPMNRVRVKFSGSLAQFVGDVWVKMELERRIINQFGSRFRTLGAQFDGGHLDQGLIFFDMWNSLPVAMLEGILQEVMADISALTDLNNNVIQVVNFVVVPCLDSDCSFGETEEACRTDVENWCPSVDLCLPDDGTVAVVCPEGPAPDVFYVRMGLSASGLFNTCKGRYAYLRYMRYKLDWLGKQIQPQLVEHVQDLAVRVEHVYVQPRSTANDNLEVVAQLHADPDTIAAANVTDHMESFMLIGYMLEHYHIKMEDTPSVVMVPADSDWTFVYPNLLLDGAANHVNLSLVLPEDILLERVTVDCTQSSQLIQVKPQGGEFGDTATVTPLSQMIYARHSVTSFTNIRCDLVSAEDSVVQASIRFLATGIGPYRFEEISGVTLRDNSLPLEMEEDSGCMTLPEDIFIFQDEKEALFHALTNWPQAMAGTNEHWVNAGPTIEHILTNMRNNHVEAIKSGKAIIDLVPNSAGVIPSVTVKYRGEYLEEGFKTSIFSCKHLLTICPKHNVDEDFELKVTPHLTSWTDQPIQADDLIIPVRMLPTNDRPIARKLRRDFDHSLSSGVAHMTFPRSPRLDLDDPPYAVPEFDVCEIAQELFYDIDTPKDTTEDLGLAILGFEDATVEGTWSWIGADAAETVIPEFSPNIYTVSTGTSTVSPAVLLECPGSKLKFTPTADYEGDPWMARASPRIVILAWDMTNREQLGHSRHIDVHIEPCTWNADKWCVQGDDTSLSATPMSVPLVRRGCDNVPKSGLAMEVCGCGLPDVATCADCHGDPHGDAVQDSCNRCVGGNTGLALEVCEGDGCVPDCSDAQCWDANELLCESLEELNEIFEAICPVDGEVINPDLDYETDADCFVCGEDKCVDCSGERNGKRCCSVECIPETQVEDDCFLCGEDTCVDCSGERNGNKLTNLCGDCVTPASLADNCNIGPFKPEFVLNNPLVNISGVATEGLIPDAARASELTCEISAVSGTANSPNDVFVPDILGSPVYNFDKRTITLTTSVPRASLSAAKGEYSVSCYLAGEVIPGSSDATITRVANPTITSMSPSVVTYAELARTTITITGQNFIDTGVVRCLVHCDDDDEDDADLGVCQRGLPGRWVDEQTVTCSTKDIQLFRRAGEFRINVVLGWPSQVDRNSLPDALVLTVRAQAPQVTGDGALLHAYGCKVMRINFNMEVSGAGPRATLCSDYFTNSELADAKCMIYRKKILLVIFKTEIAAGTVLTFVAGVIKHADSDITFADTVSGQVTVVAQIPTKNLPVVVIQDGPSTVGCKPVTLKTYTKNKGCFVVEKIWTVSVAVEIDAALQTNLDALNDAIAGEEHFTIKAEQLMDGIEYTFTLAWSVGDNQYTGSASVTLTKDTSAIATAEIVQPHNLAEVDPGKQLQLEAKLAGCLSSLENMEKTWSVAGPTIHNNLLSGSRTMIPKHTLKYSSIYTATFTLTLDSVPITVQKEFTTKEKPLVAAVLHGEDSSSDTIERRAEDDVQLECINKADAEDEDEVSCVWMCTDNYWGESEMDSSPCLDDTGALLVKEGSSITLEARNRKYRIERDTKQTWTLIMKNTKSQKVSTTDRTLVFKSTQDLETGDIVFPEIYLRSYELIFVTGDTKKVNVRAYCKSATGYRWEGNDEDEDGHMPLELTNDFVDGPLEKPVRRNTEKYVSCGIRLDLEQMNAAGLGLLTGEIYSFRIKLVNRLTSTFFFSKTQTVRILMVAPPTPGSIHVFASDDPIIAMTTELDIVLLDWYDDVDGYDLSCDVIYTNENGEWEYANALPVTPIRGVTELTMEEGVYDFEVTCCNSFDLCATAHMDTPVTVDPFEDDDIITVVTSFTIKLKMNPVFLLNMVQAMFTAVEDALAASDEEKTTANSRLKSAASAEVTDMVTEGMSYETVDEQSNALESSRLIMMEIEEGRSFGRQTEYTFRVAVVQLVQTATGRGSENDRKKRSTHQSSGPGFTESQAVNTLETHIHLMGDRNNLVEEKALEMRDVMDGVMIAMCIKQPELGTVMVADASFADIRVHTVAMNGTASTEFYVGCDNCTQNPAKVVYGSDIEAAYGSSWNHSVWILDDVCVASAQVSVDYLTPTSVVAAAPPVSDIVVLKMINPITHDTEVHDSLSDPVLVTMTIDNNATEVNETKYDYKCKMWVSETWSDAECTAAAPQMVGDVYKVVCSCTALGAVGIFQVLKPEDEEDTSTTSVPTSTTTLTTTAVPSLSLSPGTRRLDCEFTFVESYDSVADKTATKISLKNQLVSLAGITANNVKELQIARGSIVVTFELHPSGSLTLGQMGYVVQTLITSPSTAFTDSNGGALTIIPGSFSYKEMKDDGEEDKKTDILPYIIGGSIGGLAIIGWIIIAVVMIVKKQTAHKTGPAEQPQSLVPTAAISGNQQIGYMPSLPTIPNYQLAPPPPYMYEAPQVAPVFPSNKTAPQVAPMSPSNKVAPMTPSKTAKWEEVNEIRQVKEADGQHGGDDRPSGSRGNSNLSKDTSLESNRDEKAPTPVGE